MRKFTFPNYGGVSITIIYMHKIFPYNRMGAASSLKTKVLKNEHTTLAEVVCPIKLDSSTLLSDRDWSVTLIFRWLPRGPADRLSSLFNEFFHAYNIDRAIGGCIEGVRQSLGFVLRTDIDVCLLNQLNEFVSL